MRNTTTLLVFSALVAATQTGCPPDEPSPSPTASATESPDPTPTATAGQQTDTPPVTATPSPTAVATPTLSETDGDGDGLTADVDCDDGNAEIGGPTTWYADADGDGFGAMSEDTVEACEAPEGYGADEDCDDTSRAVYPGRLDVCDGVDNASSHQGMAAYSKKRGRAPVHFFPQLLGRICCLLKNRVNTSSSNGRIARRVYGEDWSPVVCVFSLDLPLTVMCNP